MNYKKIFLYLFLFIIIFLLGGISGGFVVKNNIKIEKDRILSDCWDNARKELVGTCRPPLVINDNTAVTNFYGKLLEINSELNQIVIDPAPLDDGEDKISSLVLEISADTAIEQVIKKNDVEYQKELAEFDKKFEIDKNAVYPMQYFNKKSDFSAFQVGQSATVTSTEDVRGKSSVKAVMIKINYQ
ncbi:MAG: hypothetical protein US83_C0009G0006 [Candidatus Falkowbacteria bacterium GW2011_GWC2_38_22]|uniref:Uncharacterized protein n=1 Tax=Candidatus Falkowbacteria bacterium GW2011_GWE1_38_31 TaxID=1618638 RepID=A0A0G0JTH1_9BACT|nr:MAG: hypothetical protein US73_C0012G0006 [Candidatus Falkowbacteria bacterium GW2011_GWF2_38_1205]KKQ61100.1 MAG: hypothetical protein US83_C0009G0006 [Candidatus Falkowbacteria bacterium GW2011_GWC2_38_22]KKQ63170.1 MAG: hypothetical protein US84_C0008G0063 [Candidatus Falkowbacteria bacterium GW2011_GWF1_38_22]KKQ65365.1 MAG: hypothetical protein US87_C0008G0061 [Candidatus Falkowbacteria bacterium GW2011_GWE2_38_254]KKQ69942.1 MAG: hypothetical protein US91_C0008G0062 [Candidatus Falkowb